MKEEKQKRPFELLVSLIARLDLPSNATEDEKNEAARIDCQNYATYENELGGGTPLDRTDADRKDIYRRSSVLFRGMFEKTKTPSRLKYEQNLVVFGELEHYHNDDGDHSHDDDIARLDSWLSEREHLYPEVAAVYSVQQGRDERTWD